MLVCTIVAAVLATAPAQNADSREVVRKGLKWLADAQAKDGTWSGNMNTSRVLSTAYAGLAFLMEGSTLQHGEYAANLRAAVAWFEGVARPTGALVPADDPFEQNRTMMSHSSALLFLASACDSDDDPARRKRLTRLLEAAVKYAADGQTSRRGWGFLPAAQGSDYDDVPSTAFMLQALLAAERAGVKVPRPVIDRAARYVAAATSPRGGLVGSVFNDPTAAGPDQTLSTAAGAAACLKLDRPPGGLKKWVAFTGSHFPPLPGPNQPRGLGLVSSYLLQEYLAAARVAHAVGDTGHRALDPAAGEGELLRWSPYRARLFAYLRAVQQPAGNWSDPYVGNAYGTALALITLQLDNDYVPAFSR